MSSYKIIGINPFSAIDPNDYYESMKDRFTDLRRSRRDSFNLGFVFETFIKSQPIREGVASLIRFVEKSFPIIFSKEVTIHPRSFVRKGLITAKQSREIYSFLLGNHYIDPHTGKRLRQDPMLDTKIVNWMNGKGYPICLVTDTLFGPLLSAINPEDNYKSYQHNNYFIIEDNSHEDNDYVREFQNAVTLVHYFLPTALALLLNVQVSEFVNDSEFNYEDRIKYGLDQYGTIVPNNNMGIPIPQEVKKIYDKKMLINLLSRPWPAGNENNQFVREMRNKDFFFIQDVFKPNGRNRAVRKYLFEKQLLRDFNDLKLNSNSILWINGLIRDLSAYYFYQGQ
ncbi:MAG: hypothetical protein A2Y40_03610 [Candidatus Margulisbacteria bacterium GWF2_35_9]|nr:MAG: hypothetical protein A2Y40_03610 [Candidatus Margulisbacteria bacterium GWF2_35_9]